MSDNPWNDAVRDLNEIDHAHADLTVDQKLKVAEINALLAIGQELSLIQDSGINPEWRPRHF